MKDFLLFGIVGLIILVGAYDMILIHRVLGI